MIRERLGALVGETCWSAMAGPGSDWVLVLELGKKQRRSLRLANPRLSFVQRTFEGEVSVLVESSWRIDGPDEVVATCQDDEGPGGRRLRGLAELEDRKVVQVDTAAPGYDLTITFEGGYVLRTLSAEVDPTGKRGNWSFWSPEGAISVASRSHVVLSTPREAAVELDRYRRMVSPDPDDEVPVIPRRRRPNVDPDTP